MEVALDVLRSANSVMAKVIELEKVNLTKAQATLEAGEHLATAMKFMDASWEKQKEITKMNMESNKIICDVLKRTMKWNEDCKKSEEEKRQEALRNQPQVCDFRTSTLLPDASLHSENLENMSEDDGDGSVAENSMDVVNKTITKLCNTIVASQKSNFKTNIKRDYMLRQKSDINLWLDHLKSELTANDLIDVIDSSQVREDLSLIHI